MRLPEHDTYPTIVDYLAGNLAPGRKLLCPFHDDQRPTANVLPGKGRFWCHRCHIAEDPLGVVMRLFPEEFGKRRPQDFVNARRWLDRHGWAPEIGRYRGPTDTPKAIPTPSTWR